MEGFSRTLKGNAEKDLDCEEALECFSRRRRSFICEDVRRIPLRASNLHTFERCVFAFGKTQKLTAVSLNCYEFVSTRFYKKPRNKQIDPETHLKLKMEEKVMIKKISDSIGTKQKDLKEWEKVAHIE